MVTGLEIFFVAQCAALAAALIGIVAVAGGARLALRSAATLSLWLGLTCAIAATGRLTFTGTLPPPVMILVLVSTALTTAIGLSRFGALLVERAGIRLLIGYQVFRVLVEIFLWWGHREGIVPVQMTFEGRNWDILTGLTAPIAAWFATRNKAAVAIWNAAGLALLINIVTVAILSMPTPFRAFQNEPANTFVASAPYVWLPAFLVQAAWLGHLLVFRWLRRRRKT